jgi:hypothetical protein
MDFFMGSPSSSEGGRGCDHQGDHADMQHEVWAASTPHAVIL